MHGHTLQTTRQRAGYLEEGEAVTQLAGQQAPAQDKSRYDVIVIGGGQSGLAVGYFLKQRGLDFIILDAAERTGDAWRHRWDSLRLFTPAWLDGLPAVPYPAPDYYFPTKDEMADFLERYAARFELPIRHGTRVERLTKRDGVFVAETSDGEFAADQVVVAMSDHQAPFVPPFAKQLGSDIVQLHSRDYKEPAQLREGDVLIVGAGNSGAEIAKELAGRHRVFISGRDVGQIPFRVDGFFGRLFLTRLVVRVLFHRVLTIRTFLGRKLYRALTTGSGPLIRVKGRHLAALGVERVPRTTGASNGLPQLEDGRVIDVANVVWCTGYEGTLPWIDLPVLDANGKPQHVGGIATNEPGLYFVGRHFLYSLSSEMVHAATRDAARIVAAVAAARA